MSVAGRETTSRENPDRESDLWFHMNRGNGIHCPLLDDCQTRQKGVWCPDDHCEQLHESVEAKQLSISNYDFVEAGLCEGIIPMVRKLAYRYLEMGEITSPPVPTNLISLIDSKHIEVRLLPLKACHGAIWHLKEDWIIHLNAGGTSAMKRFILFHEAFHVLAHRNVTSIFKKRGRVRRIFHELLADVFAGSILVPNEWSVAKWQEIGDLKQMAKLFEVPEPLMGIKLRANSLI